MDELTFQTKTYIIFFCASFPVEISSTEKEISSNAQRINFEILKETLSAHICGFYFSVCSSHSCPAPSTARILITGHVQTGKEPHLSHRPPEHLAHVPLISAVSLAPSVALSLVCPLLTSHFEHENIK